MPLLYLDVEQAALMELSVYMLEEALQARVKRADPDKLISDSLKLQANKLGSVRKALFNRDPAPLTEVDQREHDDIVALCDALARAKTLKERAALWERLRHLAWAPRPPR